VCRPFQIHKKFGWQRIHLFNGQGNTTNNENMGHLLFLQEKYLQMNNSPYSSTAVYFSANDCRSVNVKFVLTLQKQLTVPGFMVDIRSLSNDKFLTESEFGLVMADSDNPPPHKFLILPVVDGP
jgi:hypothetical protein